jgi:hypothetical protein
MLLEESGYAIRLQPRKPALSEVEGRRKNKARGVKALGKMRDEQAPRVRRNTEDPFPQAEPVTNNCASRHIALISIRYNR